MNELMPAYGPTVVHSFNVMDAHQRKVFRGDLGRSIRELAPNTKRAVVCVYNGEYALQDDWDWVPSADDHLSFTVLPAGGGNASEAILGVILIAVGFFVPGAQGLIYIGVGLLVSGLLPQPNFTPLSPGADTESPSPTYNLQVSGNSARLGEAIPVTYGRHIILPDFASQSYSEFDANGDQFYFCLLCLGQMDKFTLETIMIDDTDLTHFVEVETQLVGPNFPTALSLVDAAVVNAVEVANNDMQQFAYIGPFSVCGPGLQAQSIGIDIACPKGLYLADDTGALLPLTAQWLVEARLITQKGQVAGDWFPLGLESLTDNTNKAIRRSYNYPVGEGRYEVRVSRQDVRNPSARAGHDLQWLGMRAYLDEPAPLEPSATFLAVKMKATSQLSGLSQRRISVIIRRWLPTWNPDTGWSDPVETASIAWAAADCLRNQDYGGQVPDFRIDLQTLYELDQEWSARNDTFNAVFDKRVTVWSALTTIMRAGRARPIMRGSVFTFVRDSQQELSVALFSMRNIQRNSFSIDYNMLSDDDTDGLELEYFDENIWASAFVTVKINDDNTFSIVLDSDTPPLNPAKMQIMGISNIYQAQREALYIVADSVFRRSAVSFTTEMDGYMPAYGDLIDVSHDVAGWGISGNIEAWDAGTLTAICTEYPDWSVGDNYAVLTGDQGDVYGPYKVTSGSTDRSMVFIEAPDTAVDIYTGTERERTRFAMGAATSYSKKCRIVGITPKDNDNIQIKAIVEDNRVHGADAGYEGGGTAGPGRIARYAPDGLLPYDGASDAQRAAYGYYSTVDRTVGSALDEGYVYAD